jgi:toxin ParE1/3/4
VSTNTSISLDDHFSALLAREVESGRYRSAIERIAAHPGRGRRCDEVREGYRRYPIVSHVVFHVERPIGVDVIRILHQRMDSTRHL